MMKIELLGAIDYNKLSKTLEYFNIDIGTSKQIIEKVKYLEKFERANKVSAAGKLSRHLGDIFDLLKVNEENSFDKNKRFIERVTSMGHDSITDHDYLVFAIRDVTPVVEQTIIEWRFTSFTIKSRREVDFSTVGYYTPDFRDKYGVILNNNQKVKLEYQNHMDQLFKKYEYFTEKGIPKEDARFVLPYSYHSNIMMGVDAHTLRDMIIEFTKGKNSNISEIKEFGKRLYEIAEENCPYIISQIDNADIKNEDAVETFLNKCNMGHPYYKVLPKPILLNRTDNIDNTILISALMRRYQIDYGEATNLLEKLASKYNNFKEDLMREIIFNGDGIELKQVNFQYQIPLSLAVLTHLTRHRTHPILVPDFVPNIDLLQYKIPPKIKSSGLEAEYIEVFINNYSEYIKFLSKYGICEEDLVYFALSGNMVNCITNFDGKTLEHILALRECTKAQWETREMAYNLHNALRDSEDVKIFSSLIGPSCETKHICNEGKESCGKIKKLINNDL